MHALLVKMRFHAWKNVKPILDNLDKQPASTTWKQAFLFPGKLLSAKNHPQLHPTSHFFYYLLNVFPNIFTDVFTFYPCIGVGPGVLP